MIAQVFRRSLVIRVTGILGAVVLAGSASQAAVPSVESVTPICGQRGQEFTLSLYGSHLVNPADILLYQPGVELVRFEQGDKNTLNVVLRSRPEARLGAHPFRLRTVGGVSELRQFFLVHDAVTARVESNVSSAKAQKVAAECCISGSLAEGEVHWFALDLKKGQRFAAEVEGIRTGSAFIDTHLELFDARGKSLLQSDDSPLTRQDALLETTIPSDGVYKVALRETNLGGSDEARYILHLGSFPRPRFLHPAGGLPGTTVAFQVAGSTGSSALSLELPRDVEGTYPVYVKEGTRQAPTPNFVRVTRHQPVMEAKSDSASASQLPAAFHGIVSQPGETDRFFFHAKKGVAVAIQVWAWRLGSPLEPFIDLFDADGHPIASADDGEDHDSQLLFTPEEDGRLELRIRDQRGQGGNDFFYRIEVNADEPVLECFLPRPNRLSQARQTILVPRGGKVFAQFGVRRGAQESTVQLKALRLPPGVTMTAQEASPGHFLIPAIFEASAQAPLSTSREAGALCPLEVTDSVLRGFKGNFRQVVDLVASSADSLYVSATVNRLAVAVVDELPFRVELETPKAPLFQDGKLTLKARIVRKPGYDGAVELKVPFLPPWVEAPEKIEVKKGQNEVEFALLSLPSAQPAQWKVAVEASAALSTGTAFTASDFVTVKMVSPLVTAEPLELIAEQGGTVKCELNLRKQGALPEGVQAKLLELPPRVGNPVVAVAPSAEKLSLVLPIEASGPVGTHPHIVCELGMVYQGDKIVQHIGRETTLRIDPKGTTSIGPDGKPLSRLEQLRRQARSANKPGT